MKEKKQSIDCCYIADAPSSPQHVDIQFATCLSTLSVQHQALEAARSLVEKRQDDPDLFPDVPIDEAHLPPPAFQLQSMLKVSSIQ